MLFIGVRTIIALVVGITWWDSPAWIPDRGFPTGDSPEGIPWKIEPRNSIHNGITLISHKTDGCLYIAHVI